MRLSRRSFSHARVPLFAAQDTEVTVGSQGPRLVLGGLGGDKGTKMSTRHATAECV